MPSVLQYRAELDELVRLANNDLAVLMRRIKDGDVAVNLLLEILPALTNVYGAAAATLAADWYDDTRAEKAVSGRFRATVADLPGAGRTDALARWAVEPMFQEVPDLATTLSKTEGGLQRIIADAGRDTITTSSIADPGAKGWHRVTSGGCNFCRMLGDRGDVYSESTVRFGAHDNCKCSAAPAWEGEAVPVYEFNGGSAVKSTPEDRARVREWMRENGY